MKFLLYLLTLYLFYLFINYILFFADKFDDTASLSTAMPKLFCNTGYDSIGVLIDMKSNVAF